VKTVILGSGGWIPTDCRETACVLIRSGGHALLLDAGSGARRLTSDPGLLQDATQLDVILTHFHLDHVCGLGYVPAWPIRPRIWAPGAWLYATPSERLLDPLRRSPISPAELDTLGSLYELKPGRQQIGTFTVTARAQLHHWAPTAGLRIDDDIALITDTAYDPGGVTLADGVRHLLHEAWSSSDAPQAADNDATGSDAARTAADAGVGQLTLIHLNPLLADHQPVLDDARARVPTAVLGEDHQILAPGPAAS
jgi:ribonuclease BN (tRNA processing enzyme)